MSGSSSDTQTPDADEDWNDVVDLNDGLDLLPTQPQGMLPDDPSNFEPQSCRLEIPGIIYIGRTSSPTVGGNARTRHLFCRLPGKSRGVDLKVLVRNSKEGSEVHVSVFRNGDSSHGPLYKIVSGPLTQGDCYARFAHDDLTLPQDIIQHQGSKASLVDLVFHLYHPDAEIVEGPVHVCGVRIKRQRVEASRQTRQDEDTPTHAATNSSEVAGSSSNGGPDPSIWMYAYGIGAVDTYEEGQNHPQSSNEGRRPDNVEVGASLHIHGTKHVLLEEMIRESCNLQNNELSTAVEGLIEKHGFRNDIAMALLQSARGDRNDFKAMIAGPSFKGKRTLLWDFCMELWALIQRNESVGTNLGGIEPHRVAAAIVEKLMRRKGILAKFSHKIECQYDIKLKLNSDGLGVAKAEEWVRKLEKAAQDMCGREGGFVIRFMRPGCISVRFESGLDAYFCLSKMFESSKVLAGLDLHEPPQLVGVSTLVLGAPDQVKRLADDGMWCVTNEHEYLHRGQLLNQIKKIHGVGKARLKAIRDTFADLADLVFADPNDFSNCSSIIDVKQAQKIYETVHGRHKPERQPAPMLWNIKLKRKYSAGIVSKPLDEWLKDNPNFELYHNQDQPLEKSEWAIPADAKMSPSQYARYSNTCGGSEQQLQRNLRAFGLRSVAVHLTGEIRAPEVLCALLAYEAARDAELQYSCLAQKLMNELVQLRVRREAARDMELVGELLITACKLLDRRIWIFTARSRAGDVYEVSYPCRDAGLQASMPIRLAQCGDTFFAVSSADSDQQPIILDAVPPLESCKRPDEAGHFLYELTEGIKENMKAVVKLLSKVQRWSSDCLTQPLDFEHHSNAIQAWLDGLQHGDGLDAAVLGVNGVGKSTLINYTLLYTTIDESDYYRGWDIPPEGLVRLRSQSELPPDAFDAWRSTRGEGEELLTLAEILSRRREVPASPHLRLDVLPRRLEERTGSMASFSHADDKAADTVAEATSASERFKALERNIGAYCEADRRRPPLPFLLPSGDPSQSTTSLRSRIRYGSTVQVLVEHFSLDELRQRAFAFVQDMKEMEKRNLDFFGLEPVQREELSRSWSLFKAITEGVAPVAEELDWDEMARWKADCTLPTSYEEVEVCEEFRKLVASRFALYLGDGIHLHLDRERAHDMLATLNKKDSLVRVAVKEVQVFFPAAVLEGGCGFVDLPGLGDTDVHCFGETTEGLKNARVVMVVLNKGLSEDKQTLALLDTAGITRRILLDDGIQIVFVTNRELHQDLTLSQIPGADEEKMRATIRAKSLSSWRSALKMLNGRLKASNEAISEDEVQAIAEKAEFRCVYPLAHTSFAVNAAHAYTNEGAAEAICRTSNFYWLLGVLDSMNRERHMRELEGLVRTRLPAIHEELASSLDGVRPSHEDYDPIPASMSSVAASWLKTAQQNEFYTVDKDLVNMILVDLRNDLVRAVQDYLRNDASVRHFLLQADTHFADADGASKHTDSELQLTSTAQSTARIRNDLESAGLSYARKALDPRNKGLYTCAKHKDRLQILPVAFPNDAKDLDFQPLVKSMACHVSKAAGLLVEVIIEAMDSSIKKGACETNTGQLSMLRESFILTVLWPEMKERTETFFSNRQTITMLAEGDVAKHFIKFARDEQFKALDEKILKRSAASLTPGSVAALMTEDAILEVRDEWLKRVTENILQLVEKQLGRLKDDLMRWPTNKRGIVRNGGPPSNIKRLLVKFMGKVVQAAKLQDESQLREQLAKYLGELERLQVAIRTRQHVADVHHDAETIGRAAAMGAERRRSEALIRQEAGSFPLKHPYERSLPLNLRAEHVPEAFSKYSHTFARGRQDLLKNLNLQMASLYGRRMCKMAKTDLFSVFALTIFGKRPIERTYGQDFSTALDIVASQLRAICATELTQQYKNAPEDERASLQRVLSESLDAYTERIMHVGYHGDVLCLWSLTRRFGLRFMVWMPNGAPILIGDRGSDIKSSKPIFAYHLALTAEVAPDAGGQPPRAISYHACWYRLKPIPSGSSGSLSSDATIDENID